MDADYFRQLFAYDDWANSRHLDGMAGKAAPDALRAMGHLLAAREIWLTRVKAEKGSGTASGARPLFDLQPAFPLSHYLASGPVKRPEPWLRFVNREEEAETLERLREAMARNAPFGDDDWREATAKKLGLQSTLRPRGRPGKQGA